MCRNIFHARGRRAVGLEVDGEDFVLGDGEAIDSAADARAFREFRQIGDDGHFRARAGAKTPARIRVRPSRRRFRRCRLSRFVGRDLLGRENSAPRRRGAPRDRYRAIAPAAHGRDCRGGNAPRSSRRRAIARAVSSTPAASDGRMSRGRSRSSGAGRLAQAFNATVFPRIAARRRHGFECAVAQRRQSRAAFLDLDADFLARRAGPACTRNADWPRSCRESRRHRAGRARG